MTRAIIEVRKKVSREEALSEHQFVPVGNAALANEIQMKGSGICMTLPGDASPRQMTLQSC